MKLYNNCVLYLIIIFLLYIIFVLTISIIDFKNNPRCDEELRKVRCMDIEEFFGGFAHTSELKYLRIYDCNNFILKNNSSYIIETK